MRFNSGAAPERVRTGELSPQWPRPQSPTLARLATQTGSATTLVRRHAADLRPTAKMGVVGSTHPRTAPDRVVETRIPLTVSSPRFSCKGRGSPVCDESPCWATQPHLGWYREPTRSHCQETSAVEAMATRPGTWLVTGRTGYEERQKGLFVCVFKQRCPFPSRCEPGRAR